MYRLAIQQTLVIFVCGLMLIRQVCDACGDTESPRVILGPSAKDLVVGPGMNAAGRDLRGCEFVTQDLTGAVFDDCNLYGVLIDGSILKRASFRGAIFQGANVEVSLNDNGVDFTDATINGVWRSSAEGFDFYGLELSPHQLMSTWSYKNKDLRQCMIRCSNTSGEAVKLDFRGADLRKATIQGDCSKCDFTDARIYRVFFGNGSITFDQLASTSDFKRGSLSVRLAIDRKTAARSPGKWDFSRINLKGSDLYYPPPDADFADTKINDCTIRNGFTKQQLYSTASYKKGNLAGLRLASSDLSGCDLSNMNLTGCRFFHCKFTDVDFKNAVITGASFGPDNSNTKSDLLTIKQIKSTWNYKHNRMEGITLPKDIDDALEKERKPKEGSAEK